MTTFLTSKKLAELTDKDPATIRRYAAQIPGAEKYGNTWLFVDPQAAIKWVKDRRSPGRPRKMDK